MILAIALDMYYMLNKTCIAIYGIYLNVYNNVDKK
jgi:hypothetical protein